MHFVIFKRLFQLSDLSNLVIFIMSKKLTYLFLGMIAALLLALPVNAQMSQGMSRAEIKAQLLQKKQAPGLLKKEFKQNADFKKQNPRLFQHMRKQPTVKNLMKMKSAPRLSLPAKFNARIDANRFVLKNSNTKAIASIAYYPEMGDYDYPFVASFNIGSPANYTPLAEFYYEFNGGAAIQDEVYYGVNYDFSYASLGLLFIDLYRFNAETWEYLGSQDISDDFSFVADATAVANDGTVYGSFWAADASGNELGIVDYSVPSRSTIGQLVNTYAAMGITKDGQLYGIATDGNLYKIDKSTAQETLVGPTGVTIANSQGQYYYQTGEIDQTDDTFYWLGVDINTGSMALYTVDLNTGAATKLEELGDYSIMSMFFEMPAANDGAPAKVTDITTLFENGSTTGTINFTAPTETYAGGELSGALTYTILCGEQTLATGNTSAGEKVTAEVTLPEGMQTIVVITSNDQGDSPKSKATFWVGFDTPTAPANVSFVMDGNTANVSWTAPAMGIHQGFLGDLTYDVYRVVGKDTTLVAENISETTFSETLPLGELAVYSYGVTAKNGTFNSATAFSDGQALGSALSVPYYADFTNENTFNLFTTIDANNDGNTWQWNSTYYACYKYNSSNPGDDWLISPPIQLQAGKQYNVIAEIAANGTTFPERFEVKMGSQATIEGLTTTVIPSTDINNTEFNEFEGSTTVAEDGNYYFAVHAISDADQWYLKIKSLAIEVGPEPTAPAAPTDVVVTPNQEGLNEATITFTAPTKNIAGDDLTANLTKVDIYRDNVLIGTVEDIAPGATASYTDNDENLTPGAHTYMLIPYNESGIGMKSEKVSAFIGMDIPSVEEMFATDKIGTVALEWTPAVGENGGIVIPEKVSYLVWDIIEKDGYLNYGDQLDSLVAQTSYEVTFDTNVGEQGYKYWGVQPVNEVGKGYTTLAAMIVGQPNTLPLEEHFAGQDLQIPTWFYSRSGSDVAYGFVNIGSDGDECSLAIQASGPDTWAWFMPGKLSVAGIINPVMLFDIVGTTPLSKVYVVIGTPDGNEQKVTADIIPGDDFQTVKVDLKEFANQVYIMPYIYMEFEEAGVIAFDNVLFLDLMEYNLAAANIDAPAAITAGNDANILVTVKNLGENAAEEYHLKVSVDEDVIFDEDVNEPLASMQSKDFPMTYNTSIFTEAGDKNIKAEVTYELDLDLDDNETAAVISVIAPNAAGVENLVAEESHVTWSAPEVLTENKTEGFDDTSVFQTFQLGGVTAEVHDGQFGDWKVYDGDGKDVYGWESATVDYDNAGEPAAWMPFDPVKAGMGADYYTPFSGTQFMMAQCAVASYTETPASDDWLISPELSGVAQTISFYGMQASTIDQGSSSFYGFESFDIMVSYTDNNIESFQKIDEGKISSDNWEKFSFDLPEGAKYFAIRHKSVDVFALFIDDVAYITGGAEIASYNVYVDEVLYKNVTDTSIDLDIPVGDHKVSVTIVYANGVESAPVSVNTTITAIETILAKGKPVDIYTLDGVLVRSQATSAEGLKAGIYVVDGVKAMVK